MEYLDEGHTWKAAMATFKISTRAINSWRKKYKETGEVKDAPRPPRKHRKLDPEQLKRYVADHPDAYLQEIGEVFGCTDEAVRKAFKRLGITRKKRKRDIGSKSRNR